MKRTKLVCAALVALPAAPAVAQDAPDESPGVGEIIVTAQRRAENLQDTPIAITAFNSQMLTNMGSASVADIAQSTPSLYAAPYPNSPTTVVLFIRGMGSNNPFQITKDGAVGLYLDGFFLARPQSATLDMADIERVEVLRGPQGTLYGRNTTGGAVNVVTRKPTGEAGVRGNLRLGNRDTIRSLTNVDLPAWGDLAAKFTVLASNKDGWVRNTGGADYGQNEQLAGQASLRWTPGTRLTVDYSFDVGRVDSTALYYINPALVGYLPGYVVDRKRTYRPIDLPETRMTFNGHALTVELQASDAITLRSLTGYRHVDATTVQDYNEIYSTPATRRVTSVRPFDVIRSRQYSQELQLVGTFGERVNAVAGLYYFREKANHFQNVRTLASALDGPVTTINLNRDTDATSKSIAAYGQFSWTPPVLDDRLELTVGARYTEDRRFAARLQQTITTLPSGLDVPGAVEDVANRQRFRRFNPSFTVNFRPTPDLTVYGKVATGYRAGGSDEGALVFQTPHGPEDVVSYEIGLKADMFERRLRANLAAFTMDYEDVQISFLPSTAASSTFQTLNAGRGRISGVEADLSAAPVEALRLNASYAYLSTDLKSVDVAAGTILDPAINPLSSFRVGQNVANQFAFAFAPKHSVSLSGDLTLARFGDDTLALFGNYQWKSKAYATGGAGSAIVGRENTAIPAFGTADARLTYRHARASGGFVSFALWSRNITDEDYKAHVIATGSGLSGYTGQIFAYGEPRTYGAEVGFEF